jgi:transcriptional regulator with XRE-family HTH domain
MDMQGMKRVGIYIAELRTHKDLTQLELAEQVDLSLRTVRNIEAGRHDPKTMALFRAVKDILGGSWDHIAELLKPDATVERARDLARRAIDGDVISDDERSFLESLTPEQRKSLLDAARRLKQ